MTAAFFYFKKLNFVKNPWRLAVRCVFHKTGKTDLSAKCHRIRYIERMVIHEKNIYY